MDVKLLIGGLVLTGIGVGAYALLVKPTATPSQPAPRPLPNPIADVTNGMMCAQVVTECADGSWAGTPCDCRNRGGVAQRKPIAVYEPSNTSDVVIDRNWSNQSEPRPLSSPIADVDQREPITVYTPSNEYNLIFDRI